MRLDTLCGENGILRVDPDFLQGEAAPLWMDSSNIQPASIADILRVHEWSYISHLEERCKAIGAAQEQQGGEDSLPGGLLDGDTKLSSQSYAAARMAAGAVIEAHVLAAVGCVMSLKGAAGH